MSNTADARTNPYVDEYGEHIGYCNACDWEGDIYGDCEECSDGEMVTYDDDPDPQDTWTDGK